MSRSLAAGWCVLVSLIASSAGVAGDAPEFELFLDGPGRLVASSGQLAEGEFSVVLSTRRATEEQGAQGWSLGIGADGCTIVSATTDGTVADEAPDGLLSGGFVNTQVVDGGVVSVAVLSLETPAVLPVDGRFPLLRFGVEGAVPEAGCCGTCVLAFVDGLQGSGNPIDNAVTSEERDVRASMRGRVVELREPYDFELLVTGELERSVSPGASSVSLEPSVSIAAAVEGAQGWSFSLESHGPCVLVEATTDGTIGAESSGGGIGIAVGGFHKSEIVDPALNGGRDGLVSAVVLSFTQPIVLGEGQFEVLQTRLECDASSALDGDLLVQEFRFPLNRNEGGMPPGSGPLAGSGQPVKLAVTLDGTTFRPASTGARAVVTVREPRIAEFVRCDANADGELNIADAIWIVNALFLGGPQSLCADAADCNDDELVDISDAIYAVDYRFLGGRAPPAPYPACGLDDDASELSCPEGSTVCP